MPAAQETIKWSELVNFTDKQKLATQTADTHDFMLYGGAAGGGKSYWLRWYPIRWLIKTWKETGKENIVAGLFCEDYPALKDRHIGKMTNEFPEWLGTLGDNSIYGLSFRLKKDFGGGILALRNLDDPSKYFSSEFALIAVDELTKNKEEMFDFLRMRKRWSGIHRTKFIAGTNPGSIGHEWVKKKFIDKVFGDNEQEKEQFAYVRATVYDNPHLPPEYLKGLQSLPERMRKAYLEGDWDIFEGQYFSEFSRDVHVVKPFTIPETWLRFRSIDPSGRNGITSCHWYAVNQDKEVYVYREYYETGKDSDEHAKKIAQLSEGENYRYSIIDSAAFGKLGLPETQAEVYAKNGVDDLIPASKNRIFGWDIVHQYLRWDEKTKPLLKIFETSYNMIRTLPALIHDERVIEDVNTNGEDHAADELRYFLQTLREQKTPKSTSVVEQRLREMREREEQKDFTFRYARN